jgi:hypothetical protein
MVVVAMVFAFLFVGSVQAHFIFLDPQLQANTDSGNLLTVEVVHGRQAWLLVSAVIVRSIFLTSLRDS